MNIYSILKSAGFCNTYTPEAKRLGKRLFFGDVKGKRKDRIEIIVNPEQPEEEKRTALQRPFEACQSVTGVYFMACRYSPFSFV